MLDLNQSIAIKTLPLSKPLSPRRLDLNFEKVIRETRYFGLFKKYPHPNVLEIIDTFFSNQNVHILTPYCEGGTLEDFARRYNPPTIDQIKHILTQILEGLIHINEFGFNHIGLNNQNILVSDTSEFPDVYIAGLSCLVSQKNGQIKKLEQNGFLAPEIVDGEKPSLQSDVFSIGVILYILCCGKNPFYNDKYRNWYHHPTENPQHLKNLISIKNPYAVDLIDSLLEPSPKNRPSCSDCLQHRFLQTVQQSQTKVRTHTSHRQYDQSLILIDYEDMSPDVQISNLKSYENLFKNPFTSQSSLSQLE